MLSCVTYGNYSLATFCTGECIAQLVNATGMSDKSVLVELNSTSPCVSLSLVFAVECKALFVDTNNGELCC